MTTNDVMGFSLAPFYWMAKTKSKPVRLIILLVAFCWYITIAIPLLFLIVFLLTRDIVNDAGIDQSGEKL